jgi:hypothetical protein
MMTPMLACGSVTLPPWVGALLLGMALLWLVAIIVAIPNVMMSCREGKSSRYGTANLVFFVVYLGLGLSLFGGKIFDVNMGIGIAVIFLVPLMAVGHFIYLFGGWRRERKAKQAAENNGGNATNS